MKYKELNEKEKIIFNEIDKLLLKLSKKSKRELIKLLMVKYA